MKSIPLLMLSLLFSCSGLLYYPSPIIFDNPSKHGYEVEDMYFNSSENISLHGWLIKNTKKSNKQGLVLQYHGNAQNITTHYASFAWLTNHGYDIFIFDYRGYGLSLGTPTPKGLYNDAQSAFDFAMKLKTERKYPKFIVVGQSLGGSIVLKTLSDEKNIDKNIDLVILDSTFRSNSAVGASVLRKSWLTILFSPLSYVLLQDTYNATLEDVRKWKYRTLCVTHRDDPVVASYLTKDIYKNLRNAKEKWLWERTDQYPGHINSFYTPDAPLNQQLLTLLKNI